MNEQNKGILISAAVHLAVFLLLGVSMPNDSGAGRTVHMDFSFVESAKSGATQRPVVKQREERKPKPLPSQPDQMAQVPSTVKAPEPQERQEQEAASGKAVAGAAEHGARGRDYSYIKALLQKNLKYPNLARRNGWEGKVVVEFTICCDGSVRDIKVVASSGKALLDNSAVQVVRMTGPFPEHGKETNVVIPIVYRLSGRDT